MRRPTVYIFVNKELQMSPGKMAAQAAHAMSRVPMLRSQAVWLRPHQTVLVMQARDEQHLNNIEAYLQERSIETYKVIDEGVNEIDPHVATAMATQVVDKDLEDIQDTFSTFKTYREKYRLILERDE